MSAVSRVLAATEHGGLLAAAELWLQLAEEQRRLGAQWLPHEPWKP